MSYLDRDTLLQAELRRQEHIEHNRGVYISATLAAAPLPDATPASKGVRRRADKVVLPASLSGELMKQGAHAQGLSFWRISARDGRSTVASALEFTAPEGVVLMPRKVAHSLWGVDVRSSCALTSHVHIVPLAYVAICTD